MPPSTLEKLSTLSVPDDRSISPDGTTTLYTLSLFTHTKDSRTSSLWLAEIGKDHPARQITSGLFHDHAAKFSPDGRLANLGRRILLLIKGMSRCLNGLVMAGQDEKDDAPIIYEEEENATCLRILDIETRSVTVKTLTPPDQHQHVLGVSPRRSPNSAAVEVAYTTITPDQTGTAIFNIVSVSTSSIRSFIIVKGPVTSLVWTTPEKMHFISRSAPPYTTPSVYEARLKTKQYGSYFAWDGEVISLTRTRESVAARVKSSDSSDESVHALGPENGAWLFPFERVLQVRVRNQCIR
ncbi:hypothetical protein BDV18DRAFT_164584 [Aspergillus unguis]